jgi:leucyl-tRNA synthetase
VLFRSAKDGFKLVNSDILNGLDYKQGTEKIIYTLEKIGHGNGKTNYRLRDAVFSRQRYWGEPFPVYYVNGLPQMIDSKHLPIILPEVEKYLPTEDGQPPLGNATHWAWDTKELRVVSCELIDNKTIFPAACALIICCVKSVGAPYIVRVPSSGVFKPTANATIKTL